MPYNSQTFNDEPLTRSRRTRLWEEEEDESGAEWPQRKTRNPEPDEAAPEWVAPAAQAGNAVQGDDDELLASETPSTPPLRQRTASAAVVKTWPALKQGHTLSFAGLLLFTAITYFRPYELIPALSGFTSMAFWAAVLTLLAFIPTQISLEGTLTARPREINLVLLLLLAGLLSIPFAIVPSEAWNAFVDFTKVITMFVVMVNVMRTEWRWRWMFWLALLVSIILSVYALIDYHLGNVKVGGDRIEGVINGGIFGNPNDMALHLVTMIPLALGLLFVARGFHRKLFYGLCALLMLAAIVVTFSRGGFLALVCASFVLAWKLGRRHRVAVVTLFLLAGIIFFTLVPSSFIARVSSSFGGDLDGGSAAARQTLLWQSVIVTLRNPLFGIGMNNFHNVSAREQVSHNAYTEVSAEMGVFALVVYAFFIWSAFRRMRGIERETYDSRSQTRVYYLAVGLQASLIGYMVGSFFASVAYQWYIYYLVGYALCLHRLYEAKGAAIFSYKSVSKPSTIMEESKDTASVTLAATLPRVGHTG